MVGFICRPQHLRWPTEGNVADNCNDDNGAVEGTTTMKNEGEEDEKGKVKGFFLPNKWGLF